MVSRLISLTSNNFTYARLGDLLGTWDVWPPAPSLPGPYRDSTQFGRISAWGYAEVIESTLEHPGISIGTQLWGYVPIGTLPEDLYVLPDDEVPGHWVEWSPQRRHLLSIYKRYIAYDPSAVLFSSPSEKVDRAWDALMRVLFETSYLTNRYAFAWPGIPSVHPIPPRHPMDSNIPYHWDPDIVDAVLVLLAPSSKTALALAHQLRYTRPANMGPCTVVGVGSAASQAFTRGTAFFDEVLRYDDVDAGDLAQRLGITESGTDTNIVLLDFGARGDTALPWFRALQSLSSHVRPVVVGLDPSSPGGSTLRALTSDPYSGVVRLVADGLRMAAMGGGRQNGYFADLEAAWVKFKAGGIPGLELKWGEGMEAVGEGWDGLVEGRYGPEVGLVYEL
ncbi:hypothetical protein B0H11DRAFT_184330 [Mycena galericulata]|nr:hypothetical protein B0H11DRAFT_184330 [Mycena galericulata]